MKQHTIRIKLLFSTLIILFIYGDFFAQNVNLDWAKSMGSPTVDLGYSGTVDILGNVYTAGVFAGNFDADPGGGTHLLTSNGGRDIYIQKLNSLGEFDWAVSVGGAATDRPHFLITDSIGNLYITGEFAGLVDFDPGSDTFELYGASDFFLLKLDPSGNFMWAKTIAAPTVDRSEGNCLSIDNNGDIYVTGQFSGSADFNFGPGVYALTSTSSSTNANTFILKLNKDGNFIWAKAIESSNSIGNGIVNDDANNVYITGMYQGVADFDPSLGNYRDTSIGAEDVFILKLDIAGNFVWAKTFGSIGNDVGEKITCDKSGNVITTGVFSETTDFDPSTGVYNLSYTHSYGDVFIQKLDSNGNFLWAGAIGGGYEQSHGITTDEQENIYTVGHVSMNTDMDPGLGSINVNQGVFVQKLDPAGSLLWVASMGNHPDAVGKSISLDKQNNIHVSGYMNGSSDFDPNGGITILPVLGSHESFVLKLRQKGISGRVYPDYNQNCSQDLNEDGIPRIKLIVQPGNIVVESNASGIWTIDSLPIGSYTITVDTSNGWTPTCPLTQNFTVLSSNTLTQGPWFGLNASTACAMPNVSIHAPFLRPGFSNQRVYVTASNLPLSFETIQNAYVIVKLDSLLTPQTSSKPFISLGNNKYRVDLDSIPSGYTEDFWFDCYLSSNAVLGQSICIDAELYPVNACALDLTIQPYPKGIRACNTAYDQSNINIEAFCDNDTMKFSVINTGVGNMTCYAPVRLFVDGQYILMDSVQLLSGDTTIFAYLGDGRTWRMESYQHPLKPGLSIPSATIERCGYHGNWTSGLVNIFPHDDADAHRDIFCGIVSGSYDSYNKTGFPKGVGATHRILPNEEIEYLIRFQNTGTDTAFTVVIKDTLPTELDILSVRTEASSHSYQFNMHGMRVLEWTFQHIMLPDSNVNKAASYGFIKFKVKQNPNLGIGTIIENKAAINFDNNTPIITNTYFHTIDTQQVLSWDGQDTVFANICGGTRINGIYYTNSGTYMQAVQNNGIDSLYQYVITVDDTYHEIVAIACDSFVLNNQTYINTGTYEQTFYNSIGCDSIITLSLTINNTKETIYPEACSSYTAPDGQVLTSSGQYVAIIPNSKGCDSIITINLTIRNNVSSITVMECDSFVAPDGQVLTSSGQYIVIVPNIWGCDSVININLVIAKSDTIINEAACSSYTAPDGQIYTSSGFYTARIINSYGCDSIIGINLLIYSNSSDSIGVVWCGDYVAPDGQVYTTSGLYTVVIPNHQGCDSILMINLTITPPNINTTVNVLGTSLVSFESGVTFQWLDCNTGYSPIIGATNGIYTPPSNGDYALELTQMGCVDTSICYAVIITNTKQIKNANPSNIKVYPNPTSSTLNIESLNYQELIIQLTDNLGRILITKKMNNKFLKMDIESLPRGVYYLSFNTGRDIIIHRVIKL